MAGRTHQQVEGFEEQAQVPSRHARGQPQFRADVFAQLLLHERCEGLSAQPPLRAPQPLSQLVEVVLRHVKIAEAHGAEPPAHLLERQVAALVVVEGVENLADSPRELLGRLDLVHVRNMW